MMCYKDRTFCNFYDCKNPSCDIRWTQEHHEDAKKWWGGKENYPVCFFLEKPSCFVQELARNQKTDDRKQGAR